ncbi:MAG TPA: cytochrome b/b6 domain-containing protein [Steroidobacteraceae bacterium]|jgi:cytochrome b
MLDFDRKILVWDAPTRLFHWAVVGLVVGAYLTWRLNWMDWHVRLGYALLTAVFFRLLWGIFGSDTARFARFMVSPRQALRHLTHLLRRATDRQVGHNPAGGWMVLLLLALLLGEALSGLYINNDVADEGPLSEVVSAAVANAITALHWILWDALLAAVALHLVAILLYGVVKRHNLLWPMISGYQAVPAEAPAPRLASPARAAILFGGSALAVAALVRFL